MSARAAVVENDHDEEASISPALDAAGVLALVRTLALERFPRERRTLEIFFDELDRRLSGKAPSAEEAVSAGSFNDLLTRLEELLEALLVGQAHGLTPR
jgi:hypothetical protein